MIAKIIVHLKEEIPDGPGTALTKRLSQMGYSEVKGAKIGKYIELDMEAADRTGSIERVNKMCQRLLANELIEDFEILSIE
jgi:phosphoribosylformylglycinamidine synthase subunit PurS